jgi:hypothetical protein
VVLNPGSTSDNNTINDVQSRPCVHNEAREPYFLLFETVADKGFQAIEAPQTKLTRRQTDIWKSSSRAVSVEFKWHEICFSIRCEIHREYFSITTFAEVAKDRDRPFSNLPKLDENIDNVLSYFMGDKKEIGAELRQYFFRDFWSSYSSHYEDVAEYKALLDHCKCKDSIFGSVFADFRGIVLSKRLTSATMNFFTEMGFRHGEQLQERNFFRC